MRHCQNNSYGHEREKLRASGAMSDRKTISNFRMPKSLSTTENTASSAV